jgi:hypothetical protein
MLRPELQTLVAAGATCRIRGRIDTYQREPHHGTVRVCLANCTVQPVHHLQSMDDPGAAIVRTDHLWVRLPATCIDGRDAEPGLCSIAREALHQPPTRLLDNISLVGRLGYYTDTRGQLGMGVQQVLPIYHSWSLLAMLAEARTRWNQYHDGQAHSEAQQLIAMVQQVLRPAKPGQAYIDTAHGPALVLLMQGVTAQLVATHAARLQHLIDTSYQAERRARAGHQRARAAARAARAAAALPAPLALPAAEQPVVAARPATAVAQVEGAAAINGYIRAQRQQHQVVPPTPPRRRPGGFAA